MIRYNYHTHTKRCGHAIGEDEDYVIEAIAMGIQELGFSDHVMLKGINQPGMRGDFDIRDDYFQSLNYLKEKYKERIKIFIGFEAEPFPIYFSYYRELKEKHLVDYLVLGNHCAIENGKISLFFSHISTRNNVIKYGETIIRGMETGLFDIVAHPDYFMGAYPRWDHTCEKIAKQICEVALKRDIPLEFNLGGIRQGKRVIGTEYRYCYPNLDFWKIAKKYNNKVIIGIDAHSPNDISTIANDEGYKLAKQLGLNIIQKIEIGEEE